MGIRSSLKTARWGLTRRKTKNLSAILALTLGVTLMVGIQITTDTLEKSFLTGLLIDEGEVDIKVNNGTGNYLTMEEQSKISALVPSALGIMPELRMTIPTLLETQSEPKVQLAGIPTEYPAVFGDFFDWASGERMDLDQYLIDRNSVMISSDLAEDFGLTKSTSFPILLTTKINIVTISFQLNETNQIEPVIKFEDSEVQFSISGIFDSNKPGMGPRYSGMIMSLSGVQHWLSFEDPSRNTNIVSSYLISYKADHFKEDIDRDFLQTEFERLTEKIPTTELNGNEVKIYAIEAPRLNFYEFIDVFFTILSNIFNALGMMIVLTGILLITNIQLMSVEDREFQTGVLRAVGEKRSGIFYSITFESVFQGLVGGLLGLIGGLLFGAVVALFLGDLFGSGAQSVQPVLDQDLISFSLLFGIFIGILTGILPALRASRVNIVDALRGIKINFEERSGRNLAVLGVIFALLGLYFLFTNGVLNKDLDVIWLTAGWDELSEWTNIIIGFGLLFPGLGIILSKYMDRRIILNLVAITLWFLPTFMFVIAFGDGWIKSFSGAGFQVLIYAIIEIIIGSVLLIGVNLSPLMKILRRFLIRFRGVKGVAQVAPALISSHKTRSTLTFAIFAIVLTLNVLVASMVASNIETTIGKSETDSRGVDLVINLSEPETKINDTSYTQELYKLDPNIKDIIEFKTFESPSNDFSKLVALKNPISPEFNPQEDFVPLGFIELRSEQIRGQAKNASDGNWRFDFYLDTFPVELQSLNKLDSSDDELLDLSRQAYDIFFDPTYKMTTYNQTLDFDFSDPGDSRSFGGGGDVNLDKLEILKDENGNIVKNPIVFVDSPLLPYGMEIYIPMNMSPFGIPNYQAFTIGGSFDIERVGGFPLSKIRFGGEEGFSDFTSFLGSIYIPERYSKYTNFFGEANGETPTSRGPDQFDSFLLKTDYALDNPELNILARKIEEFTNSKDLGYRKLVNNNFIVASTTTIYSKIIGNLEVMTQFTAFLQIYVNFGLVIGAIGMAVISIRNVSERKREIGMMRAIGFPRSQVMLAALLELVVLGIIGLIIGVVNGIIMNYGFTNIHGGVVAIPVDTILLYLSFITVVALLAGAIPGWVASKIPAAEALRYVG
jgi:ABC-type antimicrobial peptide transport system permease subunit